MTAKELAWKNADVNSGRDPEYDRRDSSGMPMCQEMFKIRRAGGWDINDHGDAEAFLPSGRPAMGDQPLSSVDASWYLPSEIATVAE